MNKWEKKYSNLLKNTQIVCRHLNEYLKEEINEQEISYIAMHFLAAINIKDKKETNVPQIIIVCGSGYGTAQVIAMQISSLFNVEIKAVLSQREILKNLKIKNECDYIISTVTIANLNNVEYIKISPMFNHKDFLKINKYLSAKFIKSKINYSQMQTAENISNVVMKYKPKTNKRQLQYEILMELIKENNNITNYPISEDLNLSDIIPPSFIRMNEYCKTWQEAIEKGTMILEDKKYITADYKKAIIKIIEEMGPQMLIVPGIVLAHLAPGEYCKKLGFSITTLKRGVIFGYPKHDPVKIIITLSLIDENKYKKPLLQLFNLLQNQQSRNVLINAKTKNEILDIIKHYSK
ncbi:PTS sugar transporter subunit IIA [Anaerofustis sp. LCP19S3_F7]